MDLLFDLDGTLTDPAVGIIRCIQHAMSQLGLESPASDVLTRFIGPPLHGTFAELLGTSDESAIGRAITLYRERFVAVGMFENLVYPDVASGLERLTNSGHRLWVVTSKPGLFAKQIVNHFGLHRWFNGIYGSELDGRNSDKADLIKAVLRTENMNPRDAWMIGDRAQDVRGGRINGTRTVGVLWGYGSPEELHAESPDVTVESMADLVTQMSRPTIG